MSGHLFLGLTTAILAFGALGATVLALLLSTRALKIHSTALTSSINTLWRRYSRRRNRWVRPPGLGG